LSADDAGQRRYRHRKGICSPTQAPHPRSVLVLMLTMVVSVHPGGGLVLQAAAGPRVLPPHVSAQLRRRMATRWIEGEDREGDGSKAWRCVGLWNRTHRYGKIREKKKKCQTQVVCVLLVMARAIVYRSRAVVMGLSVDRHRDREGYVWREAWWLC
jgi:hypothetical protein